MQMPWFRVAPTSPPFLLAILDALILLIGSDFNFSVDVGMWSVMAVDGHVLGLSYNSLLYRNEWSARFLVIREFEGFE